MTKRQFFWAFLAVALSTPIWNAFVQPKFFPNLSEDHATWGAVAFTALMIALVQVLTTTVFKEKPNT